MFKTTKTKIIGLVLDGVVALGGAVYATTALAVHGASASAATAPAPQAATAQVTQTATDSQLRSTILDMLKDHMGLTGSQAETFADQMITRMQNAGVGSNLQAMVNWCTQFIGADTNGTGSVNGGLGMMYGTTTPSAGASNPSGAAPSSPGPQDSSSGLVPGGMMGGRMMGALGLR
jgi:hypothetical protein